jgi:hypothetical protein
MGKTISTIFAGALLAGLVSLGAQAMPLAPAQSGLQAGDVTLVAEGCGPGRHLDRFNVCVPNRERVIVAPAPGVVVVEPRGGCPLGTHWSRFRRECIVN